MTVKLVVVGFRYPEPATMPRLTTADDKANTVPAACSFATLQRAGDGDAERALEKLARSPATMRDPVVTRCPTTPQVTSECLVLPTVTDDLEAVPYYRKVDVL